MGHGSHRITLGEDSAWYLGWTLSALLVGPVVFIDGLLVMISVCECVCLCVRVEGQSQKGLLLQCDHIST